MSVKQINVRKKSNDDTIDVNHHLSFGFMSVKY